MTIAYHSAQIAADGVVLEADIVVPQLARGMVLFAHGSGSSRFSPRNRCRCPPGEFRWPWWW